MKRVFLYIRVSTEEQALHGLSIEAQTAALESWAKEAGHRVTGTYTDAGISARKPASKRPALQKLLEDVRAGKGDLVVFTKLDRWFRNISEYYKVQEVLEANHVDWKTIHEDYDTSTASGRLKINIMLSVAQDEADRTSERIKAVNQLKRQKREPLTGDCPTGYAIEGKKFVKDPKTQAAVEGFFKTFLATGSVSRAQDEAQKHGLRVTYFLAHKMLQGRYYYGHYFDTDGMTPPYISKEEFDQIQGMRRHMVRKTAHNRVYIFSGLIRCGECGGRMGGRINTKIGTKFYNCTGHYTRVRNCSNKVNLCEGKIEAYLMDTIRPKLEQLKVEAARLEPDEVTRPRDFKAEIADLKSRKKNVNNLYINNLITFEECRERNMEISGQIEELEEEESQVKKAPDFSAAEELTKKGWEEVYNSMNEGEKLEFWRILIKNIRIYPDRHLEYDFNF